MSAPAARHQISGRLGAERQAALLGVELRAGPRPSRRRARRSRAAARRRGADASRAARCPTAARRRRSAAACRCSCARFQRWNSSVSSSVSASSIASPLPLSANQRASSDLPERGGPVRTAVRNGQLAGPGERFDHMRVGAADRRSATGPSPPAPAAGRSASLPRASARDAERAAADWFTCQPRARSAAARPSMSPAIRHPHHRSAADRDAAGR